MEAQKDSEGKRPYKRKLTEKRRMQNRAAQRTYRAKRKERLEFLERTVTDSQSSIPGTTLPELQSIGQEEARDKQNVPDTTFIHDYSYTSSPSVAAPLNTPPRIAGDLPMRGSSSRAPGNALVAPIKSILDLEDEGDAEDLLEFVVTHQPDLRTIILTGLRTLKSKRDESIAHDCSAPTPSKNLSPSPDNRWDVLRLSLEHTPPVLPMVPSPFVNGIFLRHQAAREVYYQNARAIGLTWEQITQHTCPSPFHVPLSIIPISTPPTTVPPDLHPTPSQLAHPHHPFLDLIPFPWFRHRAIALAALDPSAYDPWELKKDILDGGLKCWKSRARSAGQPWDRRSWEVEPWFLKKWGWLIEEQGRIEQQSKWWRSLRGE